MMMSSAMTRGTATWDSAKRVLDLMVRLANVQRDEPGPGGRKSSAPSPLALLWYDVVTCQPADVLTSTMAELGLDGAVQVLRHLVAVAADVQRRIDKGYLELDDPSPIPARQLVPCPRQTSRICRIFFCVIEHS